MMEPQLKNKIDSLISLLDCEDSIQCQKARRQLIKIGKPAVPALIAAASTGSMMPRWEAMRALGSIGGEDAMNALISHLGDADAGIRWASADSLVKIGERALMPVLKALIDNGKSLPFRDGAHHFLIDVASGSDPRTGIIEPVIKSIEEPVAELTAPVAAGVALDKLREFRKVAAEAGKQPA
ncbi:MAG: HEAT repeat domain-containing protein [Dehalogenimonas sp.]